MDILMLFKNDPNAQDFVEGETLLEENQANDRMFVLLDGEVNVIVDGEILVTLEKGEVFGELSLIDKGPVSAAVVAKTSGRCVPVDEKRFSFLVQQTPFFALHVMRNLAHKLRRMNEIKS